MPVVYKAKTLKCALVAASVLVIAGCADVRESYAPDGRKAYELSCSGTVRDWDDCYSKAESLCSPRAYDILRKSDGESLPAYKRAGGLYGSQADERSMLIACQP